MYQRMKRKVNSYKQIKKSGSRLIFFPHVLSEIILAKTHIYFKNDCFFEIKMLYSYYYFKKEHHR